MDTPILERPNVTNLLDTDDIYQAVHCTKKDIVIESIEDFMGMYAYSEIVIQYDGDKLGLILDAYDGEDHIDSKTIWFMDYMHEQLAVVNPISRQCLFIDDAHNLHSLHFDELDEWWGVESNLGTKYDLHFFYEEEFEFSVYKDMDMSKGLEDSVHIVHTEKEMLDYLKVFK